MVLKVFEAFAGVGSQRMALKNLGIEHEVVAISEIDKFAIASYEAIHGKTLNLGDISQINAEDIPEHDLFTYSFPCQDISVAGKQGGLDINSGTRSGLLWECQRVITAKNPKYLLLENVKNLVGKRHRANFDSWLKWIEKQGYCNYWKVLNAKDYGMPQNRERVFVVSILGEHEPYRFPEKQELQICLQDLTEQEVSECFYISEELQEKLVLKDEDDSLKGKIDQLGQIYPKFRGAGKIFNSRGISPALNTAQGGNRQPFILVKNATKIGYLEATVGDGIDLAYPNSKTRRGRVQKESSPTLQTGETVGTFDGYRIRKLTPLEYWRLMGFTDDDFYKAQAVNSNSQLYKQAGNSIVVPVLEAVFKQLFLKEETA